MAQAECQPVSHRVLRDTTAENQSEQAVPSYNRTRHANCLFGVLDVLVRVTACDQLLTSMYILLIPTYYSYRIFGKEGSSGRSNHLYSFVNCIYLFDPKIKLSSGFRANLATILN